MFNIKKSLNLVTKFKRKAFQTATTAFFVAAVQCHVFAQSVGFSGDQVDGITWPWMKFFNSLAKQFTGPLPMTLGILGLAGAAFALFSGHSGGASQKFILIIFAVSTCLFAPSFINYVSTSAGGLTIMGILP